MYSTGQLAKLLEISDSGVRQWTREFGEYLSPTAQPSPGKARAYDDNDLDVFKTILVLRDQQASYDEIHQELQQGTRLEPLNWSTRAAEAEEGEPVASGGMQAVEAFKQALAVQERQTAELREQVNQLHDKLLNAEIRATAAQTELEILRKLYQEEQAQERDLPPQERQEEQRRSWWDRLLGRVE